MANPDSRELVADVTRDIVAARFPEEMPLFRAQSQAYFDDPRRALERPAAREDMLAFGSAEAVTLVTPVALAVVSEVVTYLLKEVKEAVKTEGESVIESNVRHLFKRLDPAEREKKSKREPQPQTNGPEQETGPAQSAAAPPVQKPALAGLTEDQIADVHARALEKALALDLPQSKAELLADALAGSLRTA